MVHQLFTIGHRVWVSTLRSATCGGPECSALIGVGWGIDEVAQAACPAPALAWDKGRLSLHDLESGVRLPAWTWAPAVPAPSHPSFFSGLGDQGHHNGNPEVLPPGRVLQKASDRLPAQAEGPGRWLLSTRSKFRAPCSGFPLV